MDFADFIVSDRLQALTRGMDTGGAAKLRIYDGTRPAPGDAITTEVKLAELTFPVPSLDNVSGTVLTLNNPPTSTALVSGTASWARIINGAGTWCGDLSISIVGGVGEVQIDNGVSTLMVYAGGLLTISLAVLVEA